MLYDTHCHPYLQKDKSKESILKTFKKENPEGFLNSIWTNIKTSIEAINEAKKYNFVHSTIWIHPCDTIWLNLIETINKLEQLYIENKQYIVWIWECWLDYHRLPPKIESTLDINEIKKIQKNFFIAQIWLAKKYDLPVIIHNRNSKDDIYEILNQTWLKNFIFHCFSENLEYAEKLIKLSPICKISFSGIVTFKNAKEVAETAQNIPLKHILVETDAPYLTPMPYRWKEENEPAFSKFCLDKIIELRSENKEDIIKTIFENSKYIFLNKKNW